MIIQLPLKKPAIDKTKWHWWFSWRPVIITRSWTFEDTGGNERIFVWFRYVLRKGTRKQYFDGASDMPYECWEWEYQAMRRKT